MKNLRHFSIIATFTLITSIAFANGPTARQTYVQTAKEIRVLHRELGIGTIVSELESKLNSRIRETVTQVGGSSNEHIGAETHQSQFEGYRSRWDRYPNYSFGSYSFRNSVSSSVDWDVTEFIHQNSEETSKFYDRVLKDNRLLRQKIRDYVNKSERKLIRFKELGVRNLAAAYAMLKAGEKVRPSEISETVAMLGDLNFLGQHEVTTCVTVKYAARNYRAVTAWESQWARESAENSRWSTSSVSRSDSSNGESESYWRQLPRSQSHCASSTNQIEVGAEAAVFVISLSQLDAQIEGWVKSIDIMRMAKPETPLFPTFGSPYYKRNK